MQKNILIVDDDEIIRSIMDKLLSARGYLTHTAADGFEAMEIMSERDIDLIMLDMLMPKMNGIEFLKEMKKSKMTKVPILMVSGNTDSAEITECYNLGVYDFIKKPENPDVLLKRVENGLKIGDLIKYNKTVKHQLALAKKLQGFLFPEPCLCTSNLDVRTWNRPISSVGGDIFDYVNLNNNDFLFFIADVSGHGISAALFTAIVKLIFRNIIKITNNPRDIVLYLNNELALFLPDELFVTMFCGIIDNNEKTLTYVNAGHPAPLLFTKDEIKELTYDGIFLGVNRETFFTAHKEPMMPGSSLITFTDGVIDIFDKNKTYIGREHADEILFKNSLSPLEKFDSLIKSIGNNDITPMDDCSIILISTK